MVNFDDMKLPPLEEVLERVEEGSSDDGGLGSVSLPPLRGILEAYDEDSGDYSSENIDCPPGLNPVSKSCFYSGRADVKYENENYKEALVDYKNALVFWPDMPVCHEDIAKTYRKLGRKAEAKMHEKWVKKLNPDSMINLGIFNLWYEAGEMAKKIFGRNVVY